MGPLLTKYFGWVLINGSLVVVFSQKRGVGPVRRINPHTLGRRLLHLCALSELPVIRMGSLVGIRNGVLLGDNPHTSDS